jgi:hypothetical protein
MTQARPSRPLGRPDGRTKEGRLLTAIRAELTAHVGGAPSATQKALIEQAAQIRLRLAMMDKQFAETGEMVEHNSRVYLAWSNSYARLLRQLGLKGTSEKAPTLRGYIASRKQPASVEAA